MVQAKRFPLSALIASIVPLLLGVDLRPDDFGAVPDDGLDDAPAFSRMFEECKRILGQRNVKNYTVGPRPNIVLSGGATYHFASTPTLVPQCFFLSENLTDIQWIGPAGGDVLRMANRSGRPGASPHVCWGMQGIRFNRKQPPNGYPRTIIRLDYEDGYDTTHLVDMGWRLEDVRFARTSGPALDIGVGAINMDLRDNVRFDDVDTGVRWYIGPRTCNFRGQINGSTIHAFRTFLQIDDEAGKCRYGIHISNMRIEALPKGGQTQAIPRQLIEYNYWGAHGSSSDHVWLGLDHIYGQVADRENWAIWRGHQKADHTGRFLGLQPTLGLRFVTLNGPVLAGDLHQTYRDVPLWTDPRQAQFLDWLVGVQKAYAPWQLVFPSPLIPLPPSP